MKKNIIFLTAIFALFNIAIVSAQTLQKGNYTSSDGNYTIKVEHKDKVITITEPNKVNTYKSTGSNI